MNDASLLVRIQGDLTAAMKSRDAETLSTLRMLKAALMEAKTRKARDQSLSSEEEVEVLQRYVKKRREAIEEFTRLGAPERVAAERKEIDVTLRYLPQGLSDEEILTHVREAIAATGATGPKDMGRVIGAVMAKVKGRAEGGTVSRLVKQALGG
jgi:uncharacterized protein YqeY